MFCFTRVGVQAGYEPTSFERVFFVEMVNDDRSRLNSAKSFKHKTGFN